MMAIPLAVCSAAAVDLANLQRAKSALRDAAETAAVASAKANQTTDDIRRERAAAAMGENFNRQTFNARDVGLNVDLTPTRSTVTAQTVMDTQIMKLFGKRNLNVAVEVAAETVIEPACVLVNSPNRSSAIRFQGHPTMNTVNCYIHGNSSSGQSAVAQGNPLLAEAEVCLNGGFSGKKWVPGPEEGCGTRNDPYFDIQQPSLPPCDNPRPNIRSRGPVTLQPGHYCKGLKFSANSQINLTPGIYHISGGALDMAANANITGNGVMFHLSGDRANFEMHSGGTWNVTPPSSGEYRGISIFQDRDTKPRQPNMITGGGTLNLTGIVYAISGELKLQGSPQVFLRGAGTTVLTDTMTLQGSPEFIVSAVEDPNLKPNDRIIGREAYVRVVR